MVLAYLASVRAAGGLLADTLLLNCGLHDIKTDLKTGAKQVPLAGSAPTCIATTCTSRPRSAAPRPPTWPAG
jgi:hypothetical protein